MRAACEAVNDDPFWEGILSTTVETEKAEVQPQSPQRVFGEVWAFVRSLWVKYVTPIPRWYKILLWGIALVVAITAVPAFTEHVHTPGIGDFFPEAIFGEGTFYQFTRMTLVRVVAAVSVCVLFLVPAMRLRLIPTRAQGLVELLAEFVRDNSAISMMGDARGRRYASIIGVIFFAVLTMNIHGVIPGLNIAASSVMSVPLMCAVIAYVTFIAAGIREQGLVHFFKSQLFPPGIPWPIYILLTPIEFLSTFIVRPATLAIRLLCNMISGHLLLAMCYFGTATLLHHVDWVRFVSIGTFAAAVAVTLFEVFIAALQAYIFAVLTAVYIKLSVEAH